MDVTRPPIRLKLKKRDINTDVNLDITKEHMEGKRAGPIKVNLTRKPRCSPLLSIQQFIYRTIRDNNQITSVRELWDKYRKQTIHSTIIKLHDIDYEIFRDIARTILDTLEPYQITISPAIGYDMYPKLSNYDLVDYIL